LNVERKYNPVVHMVAGAAAGASAAAITTPLDVVKTLLNTQETGLTKGMIEASRKVIFYRRAIYLCDRLQLMILMIFRFTAWLVQRVSSRA